MGLMKSIYTEIHSGTGGRKASLRKQAREAEAWIQRSIRMSLVTDEEFRKWILGNTRAAYDECTACPLNRARRKVVHGQGPLEPLLAIVGGAPGEDEDRTGVPFDPDSPGGEFLRAALRKLGFDIDRDIWFTNTVACKTPRDRNPTKGEREACRPRLAREVAVVQPHAILLLGRTALHQVCVDIPRADGLEDHMGLVGREHWPWGELGICGTANLRATFATHDPNKVLAKRSLAKQFGKDLRNVKRVLDKLHTKVRRGQ